MTTITPMPMVSAGTQTDPRHLQGSPIQPIDRPGANEAPMDAPIVGGPVQGPATCKEAEAARMSAAKVEILADATKALWKTHVSDQRGLRKLTGIVRYFRGLSTAKQENESLKALQQAAKVLGKALAKSPQRPSEAIRLSGSSTYHIVDTGRGEALAAHYGQQDLDEKYEAFCKAYEGRVQDLTSRTSAPVQFSQNEYHLRQAFLLAYDAAEKAGMADRYIARSVASDLDCLLNHCIILQARELTAQFVGTDLGEFNPSSFERMASELQQRFPFVYETHGQAEQALREGIRGRNLSREAIHNALRSPAAQRWIDAKVKEDVAQTEALIRTHQEKVRGLEHSLQRLQREKRKLEREFSIINAERPRRTEVPLPEEMQLPRDTEGEPLPPQMERIPRAQKREAEAQEAIEKVKGQHRSVRERMEKVLEELEALRGAPIRPTPENGLRTIAAMDLQEFLNTLLGIEEPVLPQGEQTDSETIASERSNRGGIPSATTHAEPHRPRLRQNSGTDSESCPPQPGRLRSTHRQHQAGVPPRNRRRPSSDRNRQPGASGFSTFSIPYGRGRDFAGSRRRSTRVAISSSDSEMGFGLHD